LDDPFPENLPVVPCCNSCNQKFSLDEEYLACTIECALCGSANVEEIQRSKIKKILSQKESLRKELSSRIFSEKNKASITVDNARVENVIIKLAKGHARYESSECLTNAPSSVWYHPIISMSEDELGSFFYKKEYQLLLPEIGSRLFQRTVLDNIENIRPYWITVQEGVYRYSVTLNPEKISIKIIMWEYLAIEALWI
jgi:hypothetical protein